MDKKVQKNSRIYKNKLKGRKQFFAVLLVSIILIVGSTTVKAFATFRSRPIIGVFSKNIFATMILNNPINSNLNYEIQKIKQEDKKIKLDAIRTIEKKKKDEEEKLRRIEEENKKLEEESKRIKKEEEEKNQKIAYLTFDDGPSEKITPRILDVLSKYNIKATFFVFFKMVKISPELLYKIHEDGHAIGHHSYSHNYNYIYKSTGNFIGELDKTNILFKEVLGEDFQTKLLRFPGGSFGKRKQKFIIAAENLGYINYDWNSLNGDAEGHNLSKKYLVDRLKSTAQSKNNKKELIILMHDTDTKSTTVEALPEIIDYLIREGYIFKTLNEK